MAEVDAPAGVFNRRTIDIKLSDLVSNKRSDLGEKLTVISLNVDKFKRINDGYGHAVGGAGISKVNLNNCPEYQETCLIGR